MGKIQIPFDDFTSRLKTDRKKGFELVKEYVEKYPKSDHPEVDDELIITLVRGLRLLGINHIVLPEDDNKCPDCGYVTGKIGNKAISLHTSFGLRTMCLYCSCEGEYRHIMKHNMGDCDCPENHRNENGEFQWSKSDCLHLFDSFVKYYNRILKELFHE